MTDFLAGVVQIHADPVTLPHVAAGKARLLAVLDRVRRPDYPDVPLLKEIYPALDFRVWFGIFAPPGTPPSIVGRMSQEMNKVARDPELKQHLFNLAPDSECRHAGRIGNAVAQRLRTLRQDRSAVQHQRAIAIHPLVRRRKPAYKSAMPKPLTADCLAASARASRTASSRAMAVSRWAATPASIAAWAPRTIRPRCARTARASRLSSRRGTSSRRIRCTAPTAVVADARVEPGRAAARRRHRHGNARPGRRRADGRLRAGAVRRPRGRRRRCRPCRLARRPRRGDRIRPSRPWKSWVPGASAYAPPWGPASARPPTRWAPSSSRSSWGRTALTPASSAANPPNARPHFDLAAYAEHRLLQAGIGDVAQPGALHLCARRRFLQLSPLAGRKKRPITAAKSPPSS